MAMDKKKKTWIIGLVAFLILGVVGALFYYEKTSPKVLTKEEYVKEVIVQNKAFEKTIDNFLDQVLSYDGSKAAYDKFISTSEKFPKFVSDLEEKLGKRVPSEAKDHYSKMMRAYNIYLEAIEIYKRAVVKNPGDERTTLMSQAQSKLEEARSAMKNIKSVKE